MKYVFLIHLSESSRPSSPEAGKKMMAEYDEYTKQLRATGRAGDAAALDAVSTATCVRVRDKKRTVTDGPFAETREELAGYYALDAKDEEEALAWAAKIPGARDGAVEVRAIPDMGMPTPDAKPPVATPDQREYLLLIYDNEATWADMPEAERNAMFGRYGAFTVGLRAEGKLIAGEPLSASKDGKVVRVREGKRVVTDGPFAETREQLGGYYRVLARNLDEAVAIASKVPSVEIGTIEIRPVRAMA